MSDDFAVVNARENLPSLAARRITFSAYGPTPTFRFATGSSIIGMNPCLISARPSSPEFTTRKI